MELKSIHFFLLGIVLFSAAAIDDKDIGNANEYIDTALENLRKDPEITKHIDPLDVPGVSDKKYNLRNIKVRGLSNLYRHGDCSLSKNGETVSLIVEIAVRDVRITMDYSAKALFFWIHGDALVTVDHAAVQVDISSTDGNASVNSLKVLSLGPYTVRRIRGASFLLNWLLKIIANNVAQSSKGNIISALENEGKNALDNILKQHKLPI